MVLLGFKMADLMKLKHNLHIPEIEPEKSAADVESEAPEPELRREEEAE